jgi:oxalate decarboxylase
MGPRNPELERQNPDLLASPDTDAGTIPNLKFSFSDAHNRLLTGGWSREITARELPISTTLAGVDMRLKPGAIRELHWHKEAEWAYMLAGHALRPHSGDARVIPRQLSGGTDGCHDQCPRAAH